MLFVSQHPLSTHISVHAHPPRPHAYPTRRSSDLRPQVSPDRVRAAMISSNASCQCEVKMGLVASPATGKVANHMKNIRRDRKSTRLNSSHVASSYAVFCLRIQT